MSVKLRNVLTKRKATFRPLEEGRVRMYTDGPTVHALADLGLARRIVVNDLIKRVLIANGYTVTHVMNVTDLDDKTINASADAGEDIKDLTQRFEREFFADMAALGCLSADHTPRTSDHIEQMLALTRKLIDAGYCYEMLRSVYFNVGKAKDYGRLSGVDTRKIRFGATVDLDDYEKNDPRDFVMFKRCDLAEIRRGIGVKSEWGHVRPGWHVQCAAMSTHYLGLKFDLHISGKDLAFPHHENEIAQIGALTGEPPAHTWVHSELVYAGGKKMNRVAGNAKTVRELLDAGYEGRALRYWIITTNYRHPLHYSEENLETAKKSLHRLDLFMRRLKHVRGDQRHPELLPLARRAEADFFAALADDINISAAMAVLFDLMRKVNQLTIDFPLSPADARDILATFYRADAVLNVLSFAEDTIDREIERLLKKREKARAAGDYAAADAIRDQLAQRGLQIIDTAHGPRIATVERD